jgi:CBS domain-containing protein
MPFIVQDLIEDNPNLVTVRLKDPVELALARMIDNDFSQPPIVDEQFRLVRNGYRCRPRMPS